jgi:hypothetical protein
LALRALDVVEDYKAPTGALDEFHETESGDTSAASPTGWEKSREARSTGSNNTRVAASKPLCDGQGRTIGVVTIKAFSVSTYYRASSAVLVIEFPQRFA